MVTFLDCVNWGGKRDIIIPCLWVLGNITRKTVGSWRPSVTLCHPHPGTASRNKSFLLYVAFVRISLSLVSKVTNIHPNTKYALFTLCHSDRPRKRKQWRKGIKLSKGTLLARGGTRKGQQLARAECVPLWLTKNQECFSSFLVSSSEERPQQSRMGMDKT